MLTEHAIEQSIPVVAESAVVRIAKALAALVAALPDVKLVTVHTDGAVSVDCKSDDGVRALAAALATEAREHDFDGHRWLSAGHYSDVRIYVSGPHHETAIPSPIDEAQAAAAIAQAEAAL